MAKASVIAARQANALERIEAKVDLIMKALNISIEPLAEPEKPIETEPDEPLAEPEKPSKSKK